MNWAPSTEAAEQTLLPQPFLIHCGLQPVWQPLPAKGGPSPVCGCAPPSAHRTIFSLQHPACLGARRDLSQAQRHHQQAKTSGQAVNTSRQKPVFIQGDHVEPRPAAAAAPCVLLPSSQHPSLGADTPPTASSPTLAVKLGAVWALLPCSVTHGENPTLPTTTRPGFLSGGSHPGMFLAATKCSLRCEGLLQNPPPAWLSRAALPPGFGSRNCTATFSTQSCKKGAQETSEKSRWVPVCACSLIPLKTSSPSHLQWQLC